MIKKCPICHHIGELIWRDGKYHCAECDSEVSESVPLILPQQDTVVNDVICPICKNGENNLFDGTKYRCALCGTPFELHQDTQESSLREFESITNDSHAPITVAKKLCKIRIGMKVGMIICFAFAGIYALISIATPMMLAMTLFFGILGLVFLLLGVTPKESKFIFSGLKKRNFVIISVLVAFFLCVITLNILEPAITNTDVNDTSQSQNASNVGVRTITFSDKFTAEFVCALWENGDRTEQSMIALMDEYGSGQGGGKLHIITPGTFIEEVDDWCFSANRQYGDYAIIENIYGYSLCYFAGRDIKGLDV